MKTINQDNLKQALSILFRETFEGLPSGEEQVFLARETGVFTTLGAIDAESASTAINGNTIAAHSEHARFYIELLDNYLNQDFRILDFNQSWRISTVNEDEWDSIREDISRIYRKVCDTLQDNDDWSLDKITVAMSIITHTAYHLGAIRQMAKNL